MIEGDTVAVDEVAVREGMLATGLTRERVVLALTDTTYMDPWGLPNPEDVTDGYASTIDRDECGCCGSATIYLVGPAGRFPVHGFSGAL